MGVGFSEEVPGRWIWGNNTVTVVRMLILQ